MLKREASTVCVLVSGGVDSAVLTWDYLQNGIAVQPVYVASGMQWEDVELQWLGQYLEAIASPLLRPLCSLAFPLRDVYGGHWSVGAGEAPGYEAPDESMYLPGRNLVLLSKSAIYCALNGIERIALGVLAGNPFPDATDDFFRRIEELLGAALSSPIRIERPFVTWDKADVVRRGAALPLELTFSCIHPVRGWHCGDCNKCAERRRAFARAGVIDRTTYASSAKLASER